MPTRVRITWRAKQAGYIRSPAGPSLVIIAKSSSREPRPGQGTEGGCIGTGKLESKPVFWIRPPMLPSLRTNLDFMPSPVRDKPGLMIRDPFQYSDAALIIPPALVACLECFDGQHSELDLREFLVRLTGDLK